MKLNRPQGARSRLPRCDKQILALILMATAIVAQQIQLVNTGPAERTTWVDVAVPWIDAAPETMTLDAGARKWVAVRRRAVGRHSTIYSCLVHLAPREWTTARLVPGDAGAPAAYQAHPWVTDDPGRTQPVVRVRRGGQWIEIVPAVLDTVTTRATQQVHLRGHAGGFVAEWFFTYRHMHPVADMRGTLTWSDRADPAHDTQIESATLTIGEYPALWFATANLPAPAKPGKDQQCRNTVVLSDQLGFTDGSSIAILGELVCLRDQPTTPTDALSESETAAVMSGMGLHGVYATCYEWWGRWLGNRHPPIVRQWLPDASTQTWLQHMGQQQSYRGWYANPRTMGCLQVPGGTGKQEDFGATRGWKAINRDPRYIAEAWYALSVEWARGGLLYESDGTPLTHAANPGWITWEGYTHFPAGSAKLGKRDPIWGDRTATGWKMHDDQHTSRNNLLALYALTGDPVIERLFQGIVEADSAMHRGRTGAARGMGRLFGWWGPLLVLGDGEVLRIARERAEEKINVMVAQLPEVLPTIGGSAESTPGPWSGADIDLDELHPLPSIDGGDAEAAREVWVVSVIGPDGRVPAYDPDTGALAPTWSVWEHMLWMVGANAVLQQLEPGQTRTDLRERMRRVAHTAINHAVFLDAATQQWILPDNVRYIGGDAIPDAEYYIGSRSMNMAQPGVGGTRSWSLAGLIASFNVLAPDEPDYHRLYEAVRYWTGMASALDWETAQWWSTVGKMEALAVPR